MTIDEALKKGLSPAGVLPFNSQFLAECLGFRCGKAGLEVHKVLENPLPITIDMHYNWPWPQYVAGELYNFLVIRDLVNHEDAVYSISDDHNTVTPVFQVDEITFGVGTLMEVADFGEYAMLVNGVVSIYWNAGVWNAAVATATVPLMRTICNFKGQAIGGGITSAWHDCDETYIVWSKIGQMDFTPDRRNEAGYRRDPFGGNIYHVRRVSDMAVVFSSKGITAMMPVMEPAATFGFKELLDVGLINRGAVGGNLRKQVFVGNDLVVREVTSEGIKELGYDQYMDELDDDSEDIIVTYDPGGGDFYIGNSSKTYLLSPYGMTEVRQHPSGVWRRGDESYMLPDAVDTDKPYICSEVFDMGYKGQKTVFEMETDMMLATGGEAGVDWANDMVSWDMEYYKPLNNMGIATIIVSGNLFRFRLRFEAVYEPSRIGYIKARYKMTDLKGLRGVYAPPPRGQ